MGTIPWTTVARRSHNIWCNTGLKTTSFGPPRARDVDSARTQTLTGLTEWAEYEVQVAATNAVGQGTWTDSTEGVPNRDITVSFLDPHNRYPSGMWSDDSILWVSDDSANKVFAYDLETGARVESRDFNDRDPRHVAHAGLWSNGVTMWILGNPDIHRPDEDHAVYAYSLADGERDASKDITGLYALGNRDPIGLWSDSITMWILDAAYLTPHQDKIYAHRLSDGVYQPELDFNDIATERTPSRAQ